MGYWIDLPEDVRSLIKSKVHEAVEADVAALQVRLARLAQAYSRNLRRGRYGKIDRVWIIRWLKQLLDEYGIRVVVRVQCRNEDFFEWCLIVGGLRWRDRWCRDVYVANGRIVAGDPTDLTISVWRGGFLVVANFFTRVSQFKKAACDICFELLDNTEYDMYLY